MAFPTTLEVDRYLYKFDYSNTELYTSKFPAPREVDRELYLTVTESNVTEEDVSDPS